MLVARGNTYSAAATSRYCASLELGPQPVPAVVDPAPVDAEAHAGAVVGVDQQSGGVHRAQRRRQGDVDRHLARARRLRVGRDHDLAEVLALRQPLLQQFQARMVEGLAALEAGEALHEGRGELRAGEAQLAEAEARARLPVQAHLGAALAAADLHPLPGGVEVEEAVAQQRALHAALGLLVEHVVEDLAHPRPETPQRGRKPGLGLVADRDVAGRRALAGHLHVEHRHPHRFAALDRDLHVPAVRARLRGSPRPRRCSSRRSPARLALAPARGAAGAPSVPASGRRDCARRAGRGHRAPR